MTTTDKPSIAELMRANRVRRAIAHQDSATQQLLAAAPVLLEIAAAGKAWQAQRAENLHAALMRTEAEIEAEAQDVQRARVKRTADLAAALEKALAKVKL